jgi:Tfp pilus assembly protein PilX
MKLPRRFSGERSQAGETLIEVLMSSALMALVVVAIIGGVATTVLASHIHRQQADANDVLVSAVERVKSANFDFVNVDCSHTPAQRQSNYETEARKVSLPAGWPASVVTVVALPSPATAGDPFLYENVTLVNGVPQVTFGSTCDPGLSRQIVKLKVTSPDGRVAPTMSFIKGDD